MPSKPPSHEADIRQKRGQPEPAKRDYNRAYNATRRNPAIERMRKSARWQRVRKQVLAEQPLCPRCADVGLVTPATEIDHVVPVRVDQGRYFDRSNLEGLCSPCHHRKSAKENR